MLNDWILRLRSLFNRGVVERELDDELRFHLEQQVASHMRQGLARDEAMRRARLDFGGLDQIKEDHRDSRGIGLADDLVQDLRYALRQLRRSPGFAVLAVLCLGLGIGVNTAIFGVLNSVLLRPMPVDDPDRLIMLSRGLNGAFSYPDYREFQNRSRVLATLTSSFPMESDVDVDGESAFVASETVSGNYADVLGVRPSLGRWFVNDTEPLAVISHAVWQRRFNLRPDVLGQRIGSGSQSYTIVGVAPREFTGVFAPFRTDLWVPIRTRPDIAALLEDRKGNRMMMLFGRLRPGATSLQAATEMNAIDGQLMAELGSPPERPSPIVAEPVRGIPSLGLRRVLRAFATLLAGVVALVLLIACVNVGNLLLVRGTLRQRELAVRRALGATRRRLLQQLLTESLVLGTGGGVCGVILALWTNQALGQSLPSFPSLFPVQLELSLDWRVISFAIIISLATTVACGLLPAWRTSRVSELVRFKGEIGSATRRRRPLALVAQVVMSLVLLLLAASVLEALRQLQVTDPGFTVAGRLYAHAFIPSPPFTPETGREFYARATELLRALPGIRSVTQTDSLPLMPAGSICASRPAGPQFSITTAAVDIGFFKTMGIAIVSGRDFAPGDRLKDAATVIVNESLARRAWPDSPAVGQRLVVGCEATQAQTAVVVGVVRNSVVLDLGEPPQPHLYRPFARQYWGGLTTLLLETSTDPAGMVSTVRRTLLSLGQGIRVYTVQPLGTYVEQSYATVRWVATILTGFGLLALLLAAIGLYGVIAYRVSLRTQEIGVRMALGATRAAIFREVLWHGLAIVLLGVGIGEVMTIPLTRIAGSMQTGIRATDATMHIVVDLIWIAVALIACYVPAARAARVDPLVAVRHE